MLARAGPALAADAPILDVGCGPCDAAATMHHVSGHARYLGLTLDEEDRARCARAARATLPRDLMLWNHPEPLPDRGRYAVVWMRHALEHSLAPMWTLAQARDALAPGGWLYVEVPAPSTRARHAFNPNHYAVVGREALLSWCAPVAPAPCARGRSLSLSLSDSRARRARALRGRFEKTGLELVENNTWGLEYEAGGAPWRDEYLYFLLRRPAVEAHVDLALDGRVRRVSFTSAENLTEVAVRFLKLHQIKVPLECALDGACGATAGDLIERMRRALADARERARPREGGS